LQLWEKLISVMAQGRSSWTRCDAKGVKLSSGSAPISHLSSMTKGVICAEIFLFMDTSHQWHVIPICWAEILVFSKRELNYQNYCQALPKHPKPFPHISVNTA